MRIVVRIVLSLELEKLSRVKDLVKKSGRCRRANTSTTTEGIAGTPSAAGVCGERTNENMEIRNMQCASVPDLVLRARDEVKSLEVLHRFLDWPDARRVLDLLLYVL